MSDGRKTVLVVDDSSFMRTLVKQIIGVDEAFNVIGEAADGVSAVAMAMTAKPASSSSTSRCRRWTASRR